MQRSFDILVIGAGPAGATAALRSRRNGLTAALIEKDVHPRFHIGESFLPRHLTLLREMGLLERVLALPHVPKHGASFAMGHDEEPRDFWFSEGPRGEDSWSFNIERAPFDKLMFDVAREAGAEVFERTTVKGVEELRDGSVRLRTSAGTLHGRMVLDASGQGTVIGRHLGIRKTLPDLCRVAYFQHFEGVERREGKIGGHPLIVMCEEGWFWMIPLDARRTSVGLVMDQAMARGAGVSPDRMLAWGISRSPFVASRMRGAIGAESNHVCADFSYSCRPFAGPGYFLVGDAATFVDPIFSTGVCLGMMSAVKAADLAAGVLAGRDDSARAGVEYDGYVRGSSEVFFNLVRRYYTHGFREMFLNGTGPVKIHKAILSVLAGHVFPRPVLALRWRLAFFEALLRVHDLRGLVPARDGYSLIGNKAVGREVAMRRRVPRGVPA